MEVNIQDLVSETGTTRDALLIPEAKTASYEITNEITAIELGFDRELVEGAVRDGDDLILQLANGQIITLIAYYATEGVLALLSFGPSSVGFLDDFAAGAAGLGIATVVAADANDEGSVAVTSVLGTNAARPVISGEAAALANVVVEVEGVTFETTADEDGNWSIDTDVEAPVTGVFTGLPEGTTEIEVTATTPEGEIDKTTYIAETTLPGRLRGYRFRMRPK